MSIVHAYLFIVITNFRRCSALVLLLRFAEQFLLRISSSVQISLAGTLPEEEAKQRLFLRQLT